jgi:hypothetical protein
VRPDESARRRSTRSNILGKTSQKTNKKSAQINQTNQNRTTLLTDAHKHHENNHSTLENIGKKNKKQVFPGKERF